MNVQQAEDFIERTELKLKYMEKTEELTLPEQITEADVNKPPTDLVVVSIPKMGKGTILGDFSKKYNALVLDLEKGGYDYISARKLSTYPSEKDGKWESYTNYLKYRKLLLENKGKYDFLIIDGLSDLDDLSEIGGTIAYMNSTIGKRFNREGKSETGRKYDFGDPEWKSVLTLADGHGYQYTRKWFIDQVEMFKQISPYRIYAAHVTDKFISDNGKEEVNGSEIALTGKLKRIFASKVTSLAKLIAEDNKRFLNFEVLNDSILAGSRAPKLKGKVLISEMENDKLITYWNTIYNL